MPGEKIFSAPKFALFRSDKRLNNRQKETLGVAGTPGAGDEGAASSHADLPRTRIKYANGDVYLGQVDSTGTRKGHGVYVFAQSLKVRVTRDDKAILREEAYSWSDGHRGQPGETVRTRKGKDPDYQTRGSDNKFHGPPFSINSRKGPSGPYIFGGEGEEAVSPRRRGVLNASYDRPIEDFQGAKIEGVWEGDVLRTGTISVLNREGSVKKFTVSSEDLNLIPSPVEGQSLTLRTWRGEGAVPVKIPNDKEIE